MTFIDASAYIAILNTHDSLHKKAVAILEVLVAKQEQVITSYAVLGEVLTVGSMRYDRQKTIAFVMAILESTTDVILEDQSILEKAMTIFQRIKNKNVSWIDCYSFAIIEQHKIENVFSFDQDFIKHSGAAILK